MTGAVDRAVFSPGGVSLRLYPHNELPAPAVVSELCAQARIALQAGFDGIMTSEHHGGFAGYLPNPLQIATFVLEESERGWAAACPLLLPLRPAAQVAEEVAWLAARHPGRVGLGVAAGALPLDFEVMDMPLAGAVERFRAELPRVAGYLRGEDLGPLAGDPALRRCATHPVPVLSAAASPGAARRAAACGTGILLVGMSGVERLARIGQAYVEAGGRGPRVLIRRAWLGQPDGGAVTRQRAVYDSYASAGFGDDQTISGEDPADVAERLAAVTVAAGATALNLRVHLPDLAPAAVRAQIEQLGRSVLPDLRERLAPVR
jgi:alkanesulfonate monooxygenase SsuD/methylene tetrahydromethanopterin reductase-like flavin-dependent oxidoreductase (luciferase family)